jgi:glycosyltransferase involved in cell wall biosynthesis
VKLGHEVEIIAPRRCDNPVQEDFWKFHGVDERVRLTYTSSFDGIACRLTPGLLGLSLTTWSYLHYARHKLLEGKYDLLYTRTPEILPMLLATKIPVILELHKLPRYRKKLFVRRCSRCTLVICLTSPMRKELIAWGVPEGNIVVEPDAVDLERFRECHAEEAVSKQVATIGYAGQLESMGLSKGIPELLAAFAILQRTHPSAKLLLAGPKASSDTLMRHIKTAPGVAYRGFLPHDQIPSFLSSCDILVYPAPASSHPFYMRDTSPLKLFEYMASKKPIVTADLPPIRDILDESTAMFCRPGDPEGLARALANVLDHPGEAQKKVTRAWERVQEFTWEKRMRRILGAAEKSFIAL